MFSAIGCSSVAIGWGGGRGEEGQQRAGRRVGLQWGCLQPLWTALHTIIISLQNRETEQSWKALRALNARWDLPVIPFLRTKSKKRQTKNWSREKSYKKTDRTNIIATNFVWEQLTTKTFHSLTSWRNQKHVSHTLRATFYCLCCIKSIAEEHLHYETIGKDSLKRYIAHSVTLLN